jgi:hypothetical protein
VFGGRWERDRVEFDIIIFIIFFNSIQSSFRHFVNSALLHESDLPPTLCIILSVCTFFYSFLPLSANFGTIGKIGEVVGYIYFIISHFSHFLFIFILGIS